MKRNGKISFEKNACGRKYLRVMRGMVFEYDADPDVDKFSPKVTVGDKTYRDHVQYGKRDWLVVSNNINNGMSKTCNIVPITSSDTKADIPTHVCFKYQGMDLTVLCEQPKTVNICELVKYRYFLQEELMEQVDDALRIQFDIPVKYKYSDGIDNALGSIEDIIENIIREKVEQFRPAKKADEIDIEDAILRIGTGLEELLGGPVIGNPKEESKAVEIAESETETSEDNTDKESAPPVQEVQSTIQDSNKDKSPVLKVQKPVREHKSQVDKFYAKYPELKKTDTASTDTPNADVEVVKEESAPKKETKPKSKPKKAPNSNRIVWNTQTCEELLKDVEELPPTQVCDKWGFDGVKRLYQMKYYAANKLRKLKGE
jgi:mRNA-degrading endonuclease toxin of MazEF toxin-antitoxin module